MSGEAQSVLNASIDSVASANFLALHEKINSTDERLNDINEQTKLNTQKALDSMTFIYLMCKIEGEFNIKIPQKRWSKMQTLKDVLDEIERAK